MAEIAWGAKVSPNFKNKVVAVCGRLGCDPSFLMAAMAFETGESFSPTKRNKVSGATGLIQFMERTAAGLGTSTAAPAAMSAEDQLDFVERHFRPFKGRLRTLSDVYMAVLWPAAVGKDEAHVLFTRPAKTYEQNKGLDANRDGVVTKAEAATKVQGKLIRGMAVGRIG